MKAKYLEVSDGPPAAGGKWKGSTLSLHSVAGSHKGRASLHECARSNDLAGLEYLLDESENRKRVNKLDDAGMAPVHYAARFNNLDALVLLIEKGKADLTVCDKYGVSVLHYSARKRQTGQSEVTVELIGYLCQQCPQLINMKDMYGCTPLHFAAMRGNEVVARALLTTPGIQLQAVNHLGATPLHESMVYNHTELSRLLIQAGADVTVSDKQGVTPLHLSSMEGSMDAVQMLCDALTDSGELSKFVDMKDNEDNTALHLAIENRNTEVVKYLISKGAAVDAVCRPSTTASRPLHLAMIAGIVEVVEALLEANCEVYVRDNSYSNPLHKAAEYQSLEAATLLMERCDPGKLLAETDDEMYTPLLVACCYDNADMVTLLLKSGADIYATAFEEKTSLHLAAQYEQPSVVQVLLDWVADKPEKNSLLNASNNVGSAPLHVASENGNTDIVKKLIKARAKVESRNEEEETPFHVAARNGYVELMQLMLTRTKYKCLHDDDENSNTALHMAAQYGQIDAVVLLVKKGADKEAKNCDGMTPLDFAAASGHADVIKYLLDEDVTINPTDRNMTTPLHLAAKNGHVDAMRELLKRGANICQRDADGNNPLDLAIDRGFSDVVAAIIESDSWNLALKNDTFNNRDNRRDTPMRKLIRRMPDMAGLAMDRCITTGPEGASSEDDDFWIEFNYEVLDDSLFKWNQEEPLEKTALSDELYDIDGAGLDNKFAYNISLSTLKINHPLSLIVKHSRESLLCHPLVLSLLRHKWNIANVFYFLFLLYYMFFLAMITAFALWMQAPFEVNNTVCSQSGALVDTSEITFGVVAIYIILILCGIGVVIEVFQIITIKAKYLSQPLNLVDWFTYISAALFCLNISNCVSSTDWQWQLGAFACFVAWMDFLLFLRRLPKVGIYVVMVVEILKTFMSFFPVFFFFIVAFAVSFFILLQNQAAFRSPFYSIVKTWVMMIGEMDFTDIFHSNVDSPDDHSAQVYYEGSTYAIFIAFLVIISIIIMNLLTGLAVDDVNELQEHAKLKKLAMQNDLALDVEVALPSIMWRKQKCILRCERFYPNHMEGRVRTMYEGAKRLFEGPLSKDMYMQEVITGQPENESITQLKELENKIMKRMRQSDGQMKAVMKKLERMEGLLQKKNNRSRRNRDTSEE